MLFSVEQGFVGRDEIRAPFKTPAWEATVQTVLKRVNVHLITHTALYFKTIIVTLFYLFIIKKKSFKLICKYLQQEAP